jgi:hypothetical protein
MSAIRVWIPRMRLKRTAFQSRFNTVHGNQDSPADAQHVDFLVSYTVVDRPHTHAESQAACVFESATGRFGSESLAGCVVGVARAEWSRSTSCRMVVRIASRTDFANSSREKT